MARTPDGLERKPIL